MLRPDIVYTGLDVGDYNQQDSLRGRLFLAFPCEASVGFPHRRGCLNFFDDATHNGVPRWDTVTGRLRACAVTLVYATRRYRPGVLAVMGLALEPVAWLLGRNMPAGSTWARYGFETITWGQMDEPPRAPTTPP